MFLAAGTVYSDGYLPDADETIGKIFSFLENCDRIPLILYLQSMILRAGGIYARRNGI